MITNQQFLVLFDIAKSAMNTNGGFAGYSNEELMKLVNQIISQQDNTQLINFKDVIKETKEVKPITEGKEKNNIKPNNTEKTTPPPPSSQKDDDFWDIS